MAEGEGFYLHSDGTIYEGKFQNFKFVKNFWNSFKKISKEQKKIL
jgi:hypothetical protein